MSHKAVIKEHFEPVKSLFLRKIRGYVGICPFHKEKNGSCHYNEEKDEFYCFGCGANGAGEELAAAIKKGGDKK